MNREGNFRNPAFGEELNKILNIMLKAWVRRQGQTYLSSYYLGTMSSDGKTVKHRFFRPNVK